jgi:RNA polymerase sigma-70 factor (ECF subfamily)
MEATLSLTESKEAGPVTAEDLCRTYAASVCRFAAMVSPSPADAEDLAQEALMRAVRSLRTYDPDRGSMETWLWRIVANAAKDAAGRRQRLRDLVVRLGVAAPRESESVEDAVLARLRDADLHAELRRLPWRDRTLLALRYGFDLDMHQVGAAVGLSADSASRATLRALARLRARLMEVRS